MRFHIKQRRIALLLLEQLLPIIDLAANISLRLDSFTTPIASTSPRSWRNRVCLQRPLSQKVVKLFRVRVNDHGLSGCPMPRFGMRDIGAIKATFPTLKGAIQRVNKEKFVLREITELVSEVEEHLGFLVSGHNRKSRRTQLGLKNRLYLARQGFDQIRRLTEAMMPRYHTDGLINKEELEEINEATRDCGAAFRRIPPYSPITEAEASLWHSRRASRRHTSYTGSQTTDEIVAPLDELSVALTVRDTSGTITQIDHDQLMGSWPPLQNAFEEAALSALLRDNIVQGLRSPESRRWYQKVRHPVAFPRIQNLNALRHVTLRYLTKWPPTYRIS